MAKPYDSTMKILQAMDPEAWAKWLGAKPQKVVVCNTELPVIAPAADCMLLMEMEDQEMLHIENQASYLDAIGSRTMEYSVLISRSRGGIRVRSVVLLLRPEADGPAMSGAYQKRRTDGSVYLEFQFEVIRVWKRSPEEFFSAGLGLLPLAFLADIKKEEIPELLRRTKEKLEREVNSKMAAEIELSIELLMGLRYDEKTIAEVFKGVPGMKESIVYQRILNEGKIEGKVEGKVEGKAEGRAEEARAILLRLGSPRFGIPDGATLQTINAIQSLDRLEDLLDRMALVSTWGELLAR